MSKPACPTPIRSGSDEAGVVLAHRRARTRRPPNIRRPIKRRTERPMRHLGHLRLRVDPRSDLAEFCDRTRNEPRRDLVSARA